MKRDKKIIIIKGKYLFLPLIIILFGFILRLIPLLREEFWRDEASTFFISHNFSFRDIFRGKVDPVHTFLYYFLIKIISHFNTSIVFLRAPSLIFGLANIFLVYKIAKLFNFNKFFGLITALLMAVSPAQIEYSWWARMYNMVLFFALFSLYSLFYYLRSEKKVWLLLFTLANILGFYTDYSFFWYLLVLNLSSFLLFFKTKKEVVKSLLISDLFISLYFPVLLKVLPQAFDNISWIERPDFNNLKKIIFWFFGIEDYWNNNANNLWFLPIILILILAISIVYKDKKRTAFYFSAFSSFVLPLSLSYAVSHFLKSSIFLSRNLWIASLLPIFLEGLVISCFLEKKKPVLKTLGVFILIFIFYCNLNLYFKTGSVYYPRNEEGIFYRNLAELIEKEGNARNDFLIIADSSLVTLLNYYLGGYNKNIENELNYRVVASEYNKRESRFSSWVIDSSWENEVLKIGGGNIWVITFPFLPDETGVLLLPEEIENSPLWKDILIYIENNEPYKMSGVYKIEK